MTMTKRQKMLGRVYQVTIWKRQREMGHERMVENEKFGRNKGGEEREEDGQENMMVAMARQNGMLGILFWFLKKVTSRKWERWFWQWRLHAFLGSPRCCRLGSQFTSIRAARDFGKVLTRLLFPSMSRV